MLADRGDGVTTYRVEIKRCPNCDCEYTVWAVGSCNTLDAKFYTDGFVEGPMYDEGSALLICPGCNRYFWREHVPTQESIRDYQYFSNPERKSLPDSWPVHGRDYEDVLHQALWKSESQEKYIRIRVWWSFNCAYRDQANEESCMPPEQEANLMRLLQLLDTNDPNESITKAEVLRELGLFDECVKQLDQPFEDRYLEAIDAIKNLANLKNRRVGRIG